MSTPPYDDTFDLGDDDEEERLEPGAGESVCERCGCHSWFVRWDYVLDADRTVRVQWTCGGHDSDDWCDRVAAVAERAEDDKDEAFEKLRVEKERAPASLDPKVLIDILRWVRVHLPSHALWEIEDVGPTDWDGLFEAVARQAELLAQPLVVTGDDRKENLLALSNQCDAPTKGLHDSIVHVFGLGIPDAREDGLARLMRQQPKAPDRGAAHQVNSVSEQAEALGGSFDEQMVSNRTGFIALAQTSHGEDYERTGEPSGARPKGSQNVDDAIVWLVEQWGHPIEDVRAANGRGRSPEQVKDRLRLAGILATAKNEELFTTRTLGRALNPVAKYPERVVQRLINLVDPQPKFDAGDEPYYKHPRERKHPVTKRFMSPEEREAALHVHFGSDEARRKAGKPMLAEAERQYEYEDQNQRKRVAAERREAEQLEAERLSESAAEIKAAAAPVEDEDQPEVDEAQRVKELESHTKELNRLAEDPERLAKDPDALIELEQLRKDEDEQREAERSAEAIAEAQGRTTAGLLD
jgi:hypothetical protein